MIEHLNYNDLREREVFIHCPEPGYRIPFKVREKLEKKFEKKGEKKRALQLDTWINKYKQTHTTYAIDVIKPILEPVMPEMEAYRWEHPGTSPDPYEELQIVNKFNQQRFNYEEIAKH